MRFIRVAVVLAVAIIMAWLSANVLFNGSAWNTLPWGVLAFLTAFLASSRRQAWALGALFGLAVSYAFLWFNNTSTKTLANIEILIPLIILPALFGALCGALAAWLGWIVRQAAARPKPGPTMP